MSSALNIIIKVEGKDAIIQSYYSSSILYSLWKEELGTGCGDMPLTRDKVNALRIAIADTIELKEEQCKACHSLGGDDIEYLLENAETIRNLKKAYIQFEFLADIIYNLSFDDINVYYNFD